LAAVDQDRVQAFQDLQTILRSPPKRVRMPELAVLRVRPVNVDDDVEAAAAHVTLGGNIIAGEDLNSAGWRGFRLRLAQNPVAYVRARQRLFDCRTGDLNATRNVVPTEGGDPQTQVTKQRLAPLLLVI